MTIRFVHPTPNGNAGQHLEALLGRGTSSAQLVFCYFRNAGRALLEQHAQLLSQRDSFVVVSCDGATDLDAVEELHRCIPGHVYIHLGWATPEEKGGGSALMHSKMCFVKGTSGYHGLWVGSHNLTANALAGANLEAALVYESNNAEPVFADASTHLAFCRNSAESFDPRRLDFYRSLQAGGTEPIGIRGSILCIHAEDHAALTLPAVVHIRLETAEFDDVTKTDMPVHFFVHPRGALGFNAAITPATRMFAGTVIEENRTEFHPNGGSASVLPHATHWLELRRVPELIAVGVGTSAPVSQAAVRLHEELDPQQFLYSVKQQRIEAEPVAFEGAGQARGEALPAEMRRLFTQDSVEDSRLLFTPRQHVMERARVNVLAGTPVPERFATRLEQPQGFELPRRREARRRERRAVQVEIVRMAPRAKIGSYFFRSRFRLRADDDMIE
ncbi:hypothetical protein [Stigmatella erecta]|uniref:Uncharacterized protein n=1 Tax=Stigmatella erecta TaxID=83460 RepID=A0A1I0L6U2_9BACT|nr:hypothetical protein [Stigmatella erecta]SEU35568.1 hypothetical protein SAMN05443639_120135 [Stigmatella erecta]